MTTSSTDAITGSGQMATAIDLSVARKECAATPVMPPDQMGAGPIPHQCAVTSGCVLCALLAFSAAEAMALVNSGSGA